MSQQAEQQPPGLILPPDFRSGLTLRSRATDAAGNVGYSPIIGVSGVGSGYYTSNLVAFFNLMKHLLLLRPITMLRANQYPTLSVIQQGFENTGTAKCA